MDIHIFWEGPHNLNEIKNLDKGKDYGVYQIYGHHPLYGSSVLLYIGLAESQTFAERVDQHKIKWLDYAADKNTQVYVGRFAGRNKITNDEWTSVIELAEKLLIFAHQPVFNTQNTKSIPEDSVLNNRIYNWDQRRDLFPEVSGGRFTYKFDHIDESHIYDISQVSE